jgi:carboxypeptidase family protein
LISQPSKGFARLVLAVLAVMVTASIAGPASFAQSDQGRVGGTVKDSTGAVIPGVAIIVTNVGTGEEHSVLSGDSGEYLVTALRPATYTVKATLPGFAPIEVTGVQLVVGQKATVDLTLRPAGVATDVNVVENFADVAVDTSSATIGVNVVPREVQALPLNGRQVSQLYLQAPGSTNVGSGTFGSIRFAGRATEQNTIRYDGIEGTGTIDANPGTLNAEIDSPFRLQSSLENVQEFRVESSNYTAEFGTGTGGQISLVTKSGNNQFHGS